MRKRLLIYISVIIGCLFVGLTTYHLLRNPEYISVTASGGNEIYLNIHETETLLIEHNLPSEGTTLSYTLSDESLLTFDLETGKIVAVKGGESTLTISTSNENFGPFTFTIRIGDGKSPETPYYIKTAEDLLSIGKIRTYGSINQDWSLSSCYEIINDINLAGVEWKAIGSFTDNNNYQDDLGFSGQIFGNNKIISNLTITDSNLENDGTSKCAGLFASLTNLAVIDSIKFNNVNITGQYDFVGTLAGVSSGATISKVEIKNANISVKPTVIQNAETQINEAYIMAGGLVGCCIVNYWEEVGSVVSDYGYLRTTISMSSFKGKIEIIEDTFDIANDTETETYISLGGIAGFNLGSTIINNKSEAIFNIPSDLANLSKTKSEVIINVGGILGLINTQEITSEIIVYPLIKNNLSIITCDNLTDKTGGVIGKTPINVQSTTGKQWIIGNYYYSDNIDLDFGGCSDIWEYATERVTTLSALNKKETYITSIIENWDIGELLSPWSIDEGNSAPEVNFLTGMEKEVKYEDEIYQISNITDFIFYYNKMTSPFVSPVSRKFWLSQNYILNKDINLDDAEITEWIPIGADFTFMGTFDGNGHKIYFDNDESQKINFNNVLVDGNYKYKYGAIFAIINVGAEVKNLTIQDLNINYAQYAGSIAGINLGTITNCYVEDITIENAIYAGFMAGVNKGVIQNNEESEDGEIIYSINANTRDGLYTLTLDNDKTIYAGSIVGYNTGLIQNIKVMGDYTIIGVLTEKNVIRVVGGAVGYNSGNIINCSTQNGYLADKSRGRIYLGGFCGINDGLIQLSHNGMEEGGLFTIITADINAGNQVVGGFVASLGYDGFIERCFANISITGYYAAGFAADLLGTVSECYVKGSVTGVYIGGFACNLAFESDSTRGGSINNCYNTVSLTGSTSNSIAAGLALFIRTPGKIENCYIANSFVGEGEKYYEAYTNTRNVLTQKASDMKLAYNVDKLGTVKGIIINIEADGVENSDVKRNDTVFNIFTDNSQNVYYLTKDQCMLGKEIYETAGFSVGVTAYWTMEIGSLPILNNLNLDNIPQIVEEGIIIDEELEEE